MGAERLHNGPRLLKGVVDLCRAGSASRHSALYCKSICWLSWQDHGCVNGRSRAGALAAGNVLQWRLGAASAGRMAAKHDVTKAFACVSHEHLGQTVYQMHRRVDAQVMFPRHRRTACAVNARDGDGTFLNGAECHMGDSDAATKFRLAFERPAKEWRRAFFPTSDVRELIAGCPIAQKTCDLGATSAFLGARAHASGWSDEEINARCSAMRLGWRGMGKFWKVCSFFDRKSLVFQGRAIGAAASGLEARVLTSDQTKKLDSVAARYASSPRQGIAIYRRLNEGGKTNHWALQFKNDLHYPGRLDDGPGSLDEQKNMDAKIVDLIELDDELMDVKQMQKFFPALLRLLLNLALHQRRSDAIELKTFLMSSGTQVAVKARALVKDWVEAAEDARSPLPKAEEERNIQGTGARSVACHAGVFEGLVAEGNAVGRADQRQLEELAKQQNAANAQEMGEAAPLAKITDAREEGEVKLALSCTSRLNFQPAPASPAAQAGAGCKQGAAPLGHAERPLHTGLHELENMTQRAKMSAASRGSALTHGPSEPTFPALIRRGSRAAEPRRDKPIHQNLEEVAPLQPPRVKSPLRLPRLLQRRGLWKEVLASCVCVSVGVLHPLATEASKSGKVFTCQRDPSEDEPVLCTTDSYLDSDDLIVRRGMPFHPATLTVASQFLAVMISCCMVLAVMGAPAWKRLLDRKSLMRIAPVGLLYGLGDFLQTVACNSASAPVVLVMGQSKLLLTALLSKFMLPSQGAADWPRLIVISCAAAASTDISAGMAANSVMSDFEVQGALLALLKATLSSMGAVLSERDFKKGENYWILSFRVQLMMLCASVAILPWTCSAFFDRGLPPMDVLAEFFQGGPVVKCLPAGVVPRCVPQGAGGSCSCIDHQGWDRWTAVAVFAIVINGYATGLEPTLVIAVLTGARFLDAYP
ncbi:unnamed protein product [Prorocentrum cordatum]|uniref:Sugar phosphate transporter domain-containing protein n=1 Tax=Prorocentrum cordatum TaxID=2364126 RepID=A0ABN9ULN2_9DINO|nr:unnamed protein product [Polarella glacialis]